MVHFTLMAGFQWNTGAHAYAEIHVWAHVHSTTNSALNQSHSSMDPYTLLVLGRTVVCICVAAWENISLGETLPFSIICSSENYRRFLCMYQKYSYSILRSGSSQKIVFKHSDILTAGSWSQTKLIQLIYIMYISLWHMDIQKLGQSMAFAMWGRHLASKVIFPPEKKNKTRRKIV